jgi:hypothetical protein
LVGPGAADFSGLALLGVWRARAALPRMTYPLAVVVTYTLLHSVVLAVTRYRIPLEGLLAVFAVSGLADLLGTQRERAPVGSSR